MADKDMQVILNSGDITNINIGGTASTDKVLKKSELDVAYQDVAGVTAIVKTKLTPQSSGPSYVKGQFYYNETTETFNFQGPFDGIEAQPGHGEHVHVINNTGSLIEAGMADTPAGVSGGKVQVTKALADTFSNARVMGVTIQEIPDGEESAVAFSGILTELDTNGLTTGVPMYLSDTVPGTYSHVAPDIKTVVGGVFVADATAGVFRVDLNVNQNIPTVFGGLQGQSGSGIYSLTTTAQDIINYGTSETVVVETDLAAGTITLPSDGEYRVHFTAAISFTSTTSTRSVTLEFYDVTGATIHFPYVKNIPRDATDDSLSFSWPFAEVSGTVHKIRVKASTAMTITFNEVSFDLQSVSIVI